MFVVYVASWWSPKRRLVPFAPAVSNCRNLPAPVAAGVFGRPVTANCSAVAPEAAKARRKRRPAPPINLKGMTGVPGGENK
jgi:hypothetical protein